MGSDTINDIQVKLDKFSSSFLNGESASIDFQDFKMHGLNSIHEQYSFGHDPLRFVEGILQFSTGNFRGIDKWGDVVSSEFGRGIPNIIHASISYVAHMVSDFLNIHSLPYPGSTLLMEFGSDKVREDIAAAYRGKYLNSRIPIYQGLPSFFASIIIHGWAVYDHYARTKKISFSVQDSLKYQPMLLVSNAMISASNLTINSVRCLLGQPHTLFRVNWPVLVNTVRHSIVFLRNSHNRILQNGKKIDGMYEELVKAIKGKSVNQYLEDFESEYKVYLKENKQKKDNMKQVNSDFTLIGLGITAAVSLVTNVFQALDNRELRKQIEQLTLIVNQLQERIEELRKQKKALKLFDFSLGSEFQK